jgi:hypothetical protein
MAPTKAAFIQHYKSEILHRYAWAQDAAKLERFLGGVAETLNGPARVWACEGAAVDAAWQAIGGKGRPTLKALRALEAGERNP